MNSSALVTKPAPCLW